MNRSRYISGKKTRRKPVEDMADICTCGHLRAHHQPVPALTSTECWDIHCECLIFKDPK